MSLIDKLKSLSKGAGLTLTEYTLEVFTAILSGSTRSIKDSMFDPKSAEWVLWLEARLAQDHIGFLDKSQVNGRWGQSTTDAIYAYAEKIKHPNLKLISSGTVDKVILESLINGGVSNTKSFDPIKETYDWLQDLVESRGYKWDSRPNHMNLVGIRGYIFKQGTVENTGNLYNDAMFVAWVTPQGEKKYKHYICSTDPGAYYYNNVGGTTNPKGCAHLVPGQYAYIKGLHGSNPYTALVQNGPTLVARANRANYRDTDPRDRGWFGIHIHAAGLYTVDNWSAGCQVIMTNGRGPGSNWHDFITTVLQDPDEAMLYTLIDSRDIQNKPKKVTTTQKAPAAVQQPANTVKEEAKKVMSEIKPDKEHWAFALTQALHKEGVLAGRGKNSDGSTYFGLGGPVDMGTVIALVANMLYYSDKVNKVMKSLKDKKG